MTILARKKDARRLLQSWTPHSAAGFYVLRGELHVSDELSPLVFQELLDGTADDSAAMVGHLRLASDVAVAVAVAVFVWR